MDNACLLVYNGVVPAVNGFPPVVNVLRTVDDGFHPTYVEPAGNGFLPTVNGVGSVDNAFPPVVTA